MTPLTVVGIFAAGVFWIEDTLYYKKRQELHTGQAAFLHGEHKPLASSANANYTFDLQ